MDGIESAMGAVRQPKAASAGVTWRLEAVFDAPGLPPLLGATAFDRHPRTGATTALALTGVARESDPTISARDRSIARTLVANHRERGFLPLSLLRHFVEHPQLQDASGAAITLRAGHPKLTIDTTRSVARVSLSPAELHDGVALIRERSEWTLVRHSEATGKLAKIVGPQGLSIPKSGRERLAEVVARASATVEIVLIDAAPTGEQAGDPTPRVQMFRTRTGELRLRLRVRPFAGDSTELRPGEGPTETVLPTPRGMVRGRRDLSAELRAAEDLWARVPTLGTLKADGDDYRVPSLVACLELLLELAAADVVVEWPEGSAIKAPVHKTASDFRIRFKGDGAWFELEGGLRVGDDKVLAMNELIAAGSKAQGRFLPIGGDAFIALTEEVAQKVAALVRAQSLASANGLSVALLPTLEGWGEGFNVEYTESMAARRAALDAALQKKPRVPPGLRADLRDYQKAGFMFLAQRAEAGLGAILADDMGLGKTLQALALLLHRARKGPALVVAPTSVARNWQAEAARFAPDLRVLRLDQGDRVATLKGVGPRDVVLASYGLLVTEAKLLASRTFATVVFDEAHALKNPTTKRAAAARTLASDATIALTGTPVENHVGELHALVDVVVPSMLGPRLAFERVFGGKEEEDERRPAMDTLRALVRPLILRRKKADVLRELPPKTEVTRIIPPSEAHLAFYEAVRRRAENAAKGAGAARSGAARIQILAEITLLRRAAIDPRLVAGSGKDVPIGSKFEVLADLASDLRSEGHRLLVFSQFLEVLDYARTALEARGLDCARLDGTLSGAARQQAIDAFQGGDADVFLLSLKAGGVGLNLTAADYIVHLDPWWNPAVEDQASDRAHRIGQERPVTVVRLVTEGTIEEKVLALHAHKRQMYEQLVGGADGQGTFDADLLLSLLSRAS